MPILGARWVFGRDRRHNRSMRIRVGVCALALLACVQAGSDETKEPPQLLFLEVEGGQKVPIQIGKPFTVTIVRTRSA